jgi:hypothetical protein
LNQYSGILRNIVFAGDELLFSHQPHKNKTRTNPNETILMKKLSKRWYANRKTLKRFVNDVSNPPAKKLLIEAWLNKLTDGATSYEKVLNEKLELLEVKSAAAADPTGVNRSARLLHMVQRAAKKGQPTDGIVALPSDVWPAESSAVPPTPIKDYFTIAGEAVAAAQQFFKAVRNKQPAAAGDPPGIGTGLVDIELALAAMLENSLGEIDPELWDRVDKIRAEMKSVIQRGAAGDGATLWPTNYVSSSSGG